ncbi:MAG: hypothetical protein U0165_04445 [Polyangiaceae bacterium]
MYLTPLIGGYMADRYWGNRKSIIIGGTMMAIGQFLMFISGSLYQNVSLASVFIRGSGDADLGQWLLQTQHQHHGRAALPSG